MNKEKQGDFLAKVSREGYISWAHKQSHKVTSQKGSQPQDRGKELKDGSVGRSLTTIHEKPHKETREEKQPDIQINKAIIAMEAKETVQQINVLAFL